MQNINPFTFTVALLGAAKMVLQAFGYDVIDDTMINSIANGVAAVATFVGVMMSHRKKTTVTIESKGAVADVAEYKVADELRA